jgi:hypothetical protein
VGQAVGSESVQIWRVLPLYLVVFVGFVGYSLMIAMFTPLVLRPDGGLLPHTATLATRTIILGVLLAVYPLAQFIAAYSRQRHSVTRPPELGASYTLGAPSEDQSWPRLLLACRA